MKMIELTLKGKQELEQRLKELRNDLIPQVVQRIKVARELGDLSENDQRLIRLRYYDGLTQSKTANLLGVSQVQVSRREKIILSNMRKRLIG